jgi:hypothetical protein
MKKGREHISRHYRYFTLLAYHVTEWDLPNELAASRKADSNGVGCAAGRFSGEKWRTPSYFGH